MCFIFVMDSDHVVSFIRYIYIYIYIYIYLMMYSMLLKVIQMRK